MTSAKPRLALGLCFIAALLAVATAVITAGPGGPAASGPPVSPQEAPSSPGAPSEIETAVEAIARTLELVGLYNADELAVSAELTVLDDDNTPFLSEQIVGRPIWHVVIRDWKLQLNSAPPGTQDKYARTFDVYVDPDNGRLLKIISRWPEGVSTIPPEPGAGSYTLQMRRSGNQKYHAFPEEDPPISFVEALDGLFRGGPNPLVVEQIIAQYVLWSEMGRAPMPMWVITLRAAAPLRQRVGLDGQLRTLNHLRYSVDPRTGEWLTGSSVPQANYPYPPDEP